MHSAIYFIPCAFVALATVLLIRRGVHVMANEAFRQRIEAAEHSLAFIAFRGTETDLSQSAPGFRAFLKLTLFPFPATSI